MRAGVFLCQCGGNISGVLDLEALAQVARQLDGVVHVGVNQFMCGTEGRADIEAAVEERGLDRFVIGSCSRRFQGPTFERVARELRLGENAVAFANLREGCSFIHRDEPEKAQKKAQKIVAAAVARASYQSDLPRSRTFLHRVGAGRRRRHRRAVRRRGARRRGHRSAPCRTPAEHRRLHGPPLEDLPDRGLRHVLAGAAPHQCRDRCAHPHPHAERGDQDRRTARRVSGDDPAQGHAM